MSIVKITTLLLLSTLFFDAQAFHHWLTKCPKNCKIENCVQEGWGKVVCRCPVDCSNDYHPVCGNDNRTYNNKCLLDLHNCERRLNVMVSKEGPCTHHCNCPKAPVCTTPAPPLTTPPPLFPTTKAPTLSTTRCPKPPCLPSSKTEGPPSTSAHPSTSAQPLTSAQPSTSVRPSASQSPTTPAQSSTTTSPLSSVKPSLRPLPSQATLCASDGRSYGMLCDMHMVAVNENKNISKLHDGPCKKDDLFLEPVGPCQKVGCEKNECVIESSGSGSCGCPYGCIEENSFWKRTCGSDGRTYIKPCEVYAQNCDKDPKVTIAHYGPCQKDHILPAYVDLCYRYKTM